MSKTKNKEPSESILLEQISSKLDKLILIMALQGRTKGEQIKYLASAGYSNSEMTQMLAIPKGTIDYIRANIKKGINKNE